jgi:hypothetical protein
MRAEVDLAVEARLSQTRSAAEVAAMTAARAVRAEGTAASAAAATIEDDSEANDSAAGHHLVRNGL